MHAVKVVVKETERQEIDRTSLALVRYVHGKIGHHSEMK